MDAELPLRLMFGAILIVTIAVSTHHRRKARKEGGTIARCEEGTLAITLRIVLALPVLLAFLLYIFAPQWLEWSRLSFPLWIRWIGAVVGIVCIPLSWWMFISIGKNISETILTKQGHELVTVGPYQWVRHPLYIISLLQILALGILASNGVMLAFWLVGVAAIRWIVIPKEEENLIKVFGDRYKDYQNRTGTLLPRLHF